MNYIYGTGLASTEADIWTINYWIAHLRQSQWLYDLEDKYFVQASECPVEQKDGDRIQLTSEDVRIDATYMLVSRAAPKRRREPAQSTCMHVSSVAAGRAGPQGSLIILCVFAGLTLVIRLYQEGKNRFNLHTLWKHVDDDGNGQLDADEVTHLLKVAGIHNIPSDISLEEHVAEIIGYANTKHEKNKLKGKNDGENLGVKFGDFLMWFTSQPFYVQQKIVTTSHTLDHHDHHDDDEEKAGLQAAVAATTAVAVCLATQLACWPQQCWRYAVLCTQCAGQKSLQGGWNEGVSSSIHQRCTSCLFFPPPLPPLPPLPPVPSLPPAVLLPVQVCSGCGRDATAGCVHAAGVRIG